MKTFTRHIKLLTLMFVSALTIWSCSYTNNTSGSKQFAKKHYNRGVVKVKSNKKDEAKYDKEVLADEKMTRKEKKAELTEKVEAYMDAEGLTASNGEEVEYTPEALNEMLSSKTDKLEEKLIAEKEAATTEKERKKTDKKIKRLDRVKKFTSRLSDRIAKNYVSPGPESAAAPQGGSDLLGLLGGIFGIVGFVFAFAPYLGFLGLLLCLAAIILGALGLKGNNRGWAIAGIVLGSLGLLAFLLAFLVIFAILL